MSFETRRQVRWNPALRRKAHPLHRALPHMIRTYGKGPFHVLEQRVRELGRGVDQSSGGLLAAMGGTAGQLRLLVSEESEGVWFSAAWFAPLRKRAHPESHDP